MSGSSDSDRRTAIVHGEVFLQHQVPLGHPESPWRLGAVVAGLQEAGLMDRLREIAPRPAGREQLLAVHPGQYVDLVQREVRAGRGELSTGDTPISSGSWEAALHAAGSCAAAAEDILAGRAHNAFCAVRPPGYHARPDAGMGFCVFNNAAVAARHAQQACGAKRVLIVDWDIHHGNGTQQTFYDDPSVLYFSTHLSGHYPMPQTGIGQAGETGGRHAPNSNINVPLPGGSGDAAMLEAFRTRLVPAAEAFACDLAVISAGFDCCAGDPLGSFHVTDKCIAELTRIVMSLAPPGAVLSVLEGGYNLATLGATAAAHVGALCEP